nr:MAG TPA: hypothetical protein [Caudoviricetes sp.]
MSHPMLGLGYWTKSFFTASCRKSSRVLPVVPPRDVPSDAGPRLLDNG